MAVRNRDLTGVFFPAIAATVKKPLFVLLAGPALALACGGSPDQTDSSRESAVQSTALHTVFVIVMENHSWPTIKSSDDASYINGTLVPMGGHAKHYYTPPGNHPSEPNYIWLESGGSLGITTDDDPATNHQSTTRHLVTMLDEAKISWKAYVEGIDGRSCPLSSSGTFAAKHTPQLFFDDVTDSNTSTSANCISHVRPFHELAADLSSGTVARYNFITPDICHDMHELSFSCGWSNFDGIGAGDAWLEAHVPTILNSHAYKNNGVLFIAWDEGDESLFSTASDGPLPFLVLSPKAKRGYASSTAFTHSSLLRTVQEIFGVRPLLRHAQTATDLSEFFTSFP
jgi:phospholipase C